VQACIIHLLRNTFRVTSGKYWDETTQDVKPIYTEVNATAARSAFDELTENWGQRYPAVIDSGTTLGPSSFRSWTTTWRSAG
jgi:transposase-like protein